MHCKFVLVQKRNGGQNSVNYFAGQVRFDKRNWVVISRQSHKSSSAICSLQCWQLNVDQIGKMFVMFDKMTSIVQDIASKKDGSRESLGMRLREHSSLVRAGQNDEKFHTVCKEEIAEFLS